MLGNKANEVDIVEVFHLSWVESWGTELQSKLGCRLKNNGLSFQLAMGSNPWTEMRQFTLINDYLAIFKFKCTNLPLSGPISILITNYEYR